MKRMFFALLMTLLVPMAATAAQVPDYHLENQSHYNFRVELNGILQALATQNSGDTEPAPTYAFQLWADTALDRLKIRNATNTDWEEIAELSTGRAVLANSARLLDGYDTAETATAYTIPVRDAGGRIQAASAVTTYDVVNLGQGDGRYVKADGTTPVVGQLDITKNGVVVNTNLYANGQIEVKTTDNTPPTIGFHRQGYSGTALYEGSGQLFRYNNAGNGGQIWDAGNDGLGSGLDADLWKGKGYLDKQITHDFPSGNNGILFLGVSMPGALLGDFCIVSQTANPVGYHTFCSVTANDYIRINWDTFGATYDPPPDTYYVRVFKR